eukprot:CAMPEP_0198116606 /NCGR_PEP_ID=MMETSP1442-20131203/13488_1 /TAXON_ID= /ORGANISM="Craspedostauros australis, Strain CCMP3328" /LENGTH=272 /DNA_ID=CAMNT_0043774471 /DNA_START=344 /DNA_END=1162 /DNA_ORIENTATION=-
MASQFQMMQMMMKAKGFINSIGENPYERDENGEPVVKGQESDGAVSGMRMGILNIICAAAMGLAIFCLVLPINPVTTAGSVFLLAFSPYIMYQKCQLDALGGMRGQINMLRNSANEFHAENDKLSGSVDVLEGQVSDLKGVEQELNDIAAEAGTHVETLVNIIDENGKLQDEINKHLEAEVMQTILTTVLAVDTDEDFNLDKRELKMLKVRLSNLPAIEFDQDNFDRHIGGDSMSLEKLMEILRNLTDEDAPASEHIFRFHPESLLEEKKGK